MKKWVFLRCDYWALLPDKLYFIWRWVERKHSPGSGFSSCVLVPPFCSGTSMVAIGSTRSPGDCNLSGLGKWISAESVGNARYAFYGNEPTYISRCRNVFRFIVFRYVAETARSPKNFFKKLPSFHRAILTLWLPRGHRWPELWHSASH